MTNKGILDAIRTIFIEKMKIHPKFKNLNLKLLWREIEPRISIKDLQEQIEKLTIRNDSLPNTIRAVVDGNDVDIFLNALKDISQLTQDDQKIVGKLLLNSFHEAIGKMVSSSGFYNNPNRTNSVKRIVSNFLRIAYS